MSASKLVACLIDQYEHSAMVGETVTGDDVILWAVMLTYGYSEARASEFINEEFADRRSWR